MQCGISNVINFTELHVNLQQINTKFSEAYEIATIHLKNTILQSGTH
jgi:hypothetical protein